MLVSPSAIDLRKVRMLFEARLVFGIFGSRGSCLRSFSLHFTFCVLISGSFVSANAGQKLFLFGGGRRPPEAIAQFVELAGGSEAKILVVTWASQIPDEVFSAISDDLKAAGAREILSALKPPKSPSARAEFLDRLSEVDAVFFSGGDQSRAMQVFGHSELREAVVKKYKDGFVVAGTSAGTAMMSNLMLTGDQTPLAEGLGLLPRVILDTHFLKRQRIPRLAKAIEEHPELIGVGIDEGAALFVLGGVHSRVVGPQKVVVIREGDLGCEDYLMPNDCFNLKNGQRESCQP